MHNFPIPKTHPPPTSPAPPPKKKLPKKNRQNSQRFLNYTKYSYIIAC